MAGLYEGQEDFPVWLRSKLDSHKIGPEYDDFLLEIITDEGYAQNLMEKELEEYLFDLLCDREMAQKECREISDRWTQEKKRREPEHKSKDKDGNTKKPKEEQKRKIEETDKKPEQQKSKDKDGNTKKLKEEQKRKIEETHKKPEQQKQEDKDGNEKKPEEQQKRKTEETDKTLVEQKLIQKTVKEVEDPSTLEKEVQQDKPKDDTDESDKKIKEKKILESEDTESEILSESLRKFKMSRARNLPRTKRDGTSEFDEKIQVSQKVSDAVIPSTKTDEGRPPADPIPNSSEIQTGPLITSPPPPDQNRGDVKSDCQKPLFPSSLRTQLRLENLYRWERKLQLASRLDRQKCQNEKCEVGKLENERRKRWQEIKRETVQKKKQEGAKLKQKTYEQEERKLMDKKMKQVKQMMEKKKQDDEQGDKQKEK